VVADPATEKYRLLSRAEFQAISREEYVPIFRSSELAFTKQQAIEYGGSNSKFRRILIHK